MPRQVARILFVSGFSQNTRAKDLAHEFERYGTLVRCDVPASRYPTSGSYAFVEFRHEKDAQDAYQDMHGARIDGQRLTIQWAKSPPSSIWRMGNRPPEPGDRDARDTRRRSQSPPRHRDDSDMYNHKDADGHDRHRERDRDGYGERHRYTDPDKEKDSREGDWRRRRSQSPVRKSRDGDGARTPPRDKN